MNNTNNVIFQSLRRPNKKFDRMLLYKSIFEDEAAKCHTTINAFHLQNHIGIYFYHESHHQKITIHLQLRFAWFFVNLYVMLACIVMNIQAIFEHVWNDSFLTMSVCYNVRQRWKNLKIEFSWRASNRYVLLSPSLSSLQWMTFSST